MAQGLTSCFEVVIFLRKSFYKSFISGLGGFRARFQGLGQQPEIIIFDFGTPSQILHFLVWRESNKATGGRQEGGKRAAGMRQERDRRRQEGDKRNGGCMAAW